MMEKKKILLVEDEEILVEMYREKFEMEGLNLTLAGSAEEGLELVKKEKPDLIVLDILLPEKNGIFFLKNLREIPERREVPVVALSNYDDAETKKEAFQLGVKDYLIKTNHTPKEIIEKIKTYLK